MMKLEVDKKDYDDFWEKVENFLGYSLPVKSYNCNTDCVVSIEIEALSPKEITTCRRVVESLGGKIIG